MRALRFIALPAALVLAACQTVPDAPGPSAAPVSTTPGAVDPQIEGAPLGFTVDTCRQLGTFAIAIVEGRRDGIVQGEALQTAQAGPLTPVFQSIVTGIYAAPAPQDAAGWRQLREVYATQTAQGCIAAATGREVTVRTRG